ncbi:MAG TPA: hypothetical protein PK002_08390 [Cellvibrio sp.]|jgi:hypothetical protein|nr:hypothetical protein [Cellvibrio sp.]
MNALYQRKIIVGGELKEASSVQTKVEQDIAFLQHRISLMKKQQIPNSIVIETYENMLKSRQAVLSWLRDGNREQDIHLA